MKVQIFDPPMCCSSGVCGPAVDPVLVRLSSDLDWLSRQGVEVERFSLSQQPDAFVHHEAVREALEKTGNDCLPLTFVDGVEVCRQNYPTREELIRHLQIGSEPVAASPCCSGSQSDSGGGKCCG